MSARLSEISHRAVEKRAEAVLVVGRPWDRHCGDIRNALARNQVRHEFLMVDDAATWERVPETSASRDARWSSPSTAACWSSRPSRTGDAVGLQTEPNYDAYDVVIIGGGPGGLAAAVYGASEGLRTLLIEREAPGGQAGTSSRIENYLGFPTGCQRRRPRGSRRSSRRRRLGAEFWSTRAVTRCDRSRMHTLTLDGGDNACRPSHRDRDRRLVAFAPARRHRPLTGPGRLLRRRAHRSP